MTRPANTVCCILLEVSGGGGSDMSASTVRCILLEVSGGKGVTCLQAMTEHHVQTLTDWWMPTPAPFRWYVFAIGSSKVLLDSLPLAAGIP